jgi:SAM-dependent methyltransferase
MSEGCNTGTFALLKYKSDDPLKDACLELSELLGVSEEVASEWVRRVLTLYPARYPSEIDRTHCEIIVHVTQSHRLPHMTNRMGGLLERLTGYPALRRVLDYGGGGGKDSILYSRSRYDVTYTDLLGPITDFVRMRFRLRGLSVAVVDVRDLDETRYDIVNCMDVIEHVYDVEDVLADILSHLRLGGHLLCYPAFFNTWNGDHVEKNCGYPPFFADMLEAVGMRPESVANVSRSVPGRWLRTLGLRVDPMPVLHFVRERPEDAPTRERQALRRELYTLSRDFSTRVACANLVFLPLAALLGSLPLGRLRARGAAKADYMLSMAIDNLAIRRLSRHRLTVEAGLRSRG